MDPALLSSWKQSVPKLDQILKIMQEKTIIAVGVAPYPRIIPALFLQNYQIYCVKDAATLTSCEGTQQSFAWKKRIPR